MINRRTFLSTATVVGFSIARDNIKLHKLPLDLYKTIQKVQNHLFPTNSTLPSAKLFGATDFLEATIYHSSYDRDIRAFILNGAKELRDREKNLFLDYGEAKTEKALRNFEEASMGSGWLNRIIILCLEALLSDPIYGGNFKELGWRVLETTGGTPRPTTRYIKL